MKTAKYRSRVVDIEALRWPGPSGSYPQWALEFSSEVVGLPPRLACYTRNGVAYAEVGDYVIRGEKEVYPCKPDVFHKKYDLISQDPE